MTIFDYLGVKFSEDGFGTVYSTADQISNEFWNFVFDSRLESKGLEQDRENNLIYMPKELFDSYCEYSILVAEDDRFEELSDVRRPYYQMRGKPVTKDQAFDIIRRTDNFFKFELRELGGKEFVPCLNFDNWLIEKNHYPQGYGWIHVDGTVGGNAITQKYPEIYEFVMEWLEKLRAFPYLDLIIAVTNWEECSPAKWERREPRADETFENAVILGIRVHDKTIEILNREDTLKCYQEYDEQYGFPAEKFESKYYQDHHITQVDESYLRRCIESYGLDPDKVLESIPKYIWKGDQ